ncbi:MAG: sigma-54-dependent Fis family transcriptional regulator [Deltaproteobacteria bacterium HGW-Deltaproteobacteria-2]|jgi:transcriptional regulator with PAS, ATPase and Fis domain|nr:MAG: sigma-54-dependent Fis family transcriptional regulator [Deltaproteobacteria bacterium HGW-Deltaproteobacteria-2]
MKKKNIYISLYILIPVIFTGISLISAILTYQLFKQREEFNQLFPIHFIYLILVMALFTFSISVVMLRFFFEPLSRFINKTQKMPIIAPAVKSEEKEDITRDFNRVSELFDSVADILSNVEAKELFPSIICTSISMRNILARILKVASTDSTVLISGESGTGKELIASSVYEHSTRKNKPFVKINCVAIPEGLLESELFGHEKGSFTGATEQKKGKFEIADKGTIFLDEIGDMPLATQAKLLRVLQEKEFERVGGTRQIRVDIRFIAATNKNLLEMIKEGSFREDLYFRLNVFPVSLPALRDRKEDIIPIANYFLESLPQTVKISTSALQELIGYSWPGNIRELRNVLEQASILSENGVIELHHLPDDLFKKQNSLSKTMSDNMPLDAKLELIEKEIIIDALKKTGGIQVRAADILGINQRSLWHRIKKLQIDMNSLKSLQ